MIKSMSSPDKLTRIFAMVETFNDKGAAKGGRGSKAKRYRRMAQVHERTAAQSQSVEAREMELRLAQAYRALADNEDWLDGKTEPTSVP